MNLQITTLNINGLSEKNSKSEKLHKLLFYQNQFHWDIIFIQESHISDILRAKEITKNWVGKWFWSFGSSNSRGVGIFLSCNLNFHLDHFYYDTEGRIILVDITIDVVKFRLLNVYLPNSATERKDFINELDNYLLVNRALIIGGDWNFVENTKLDRNTVPDNVGTFGKVEISKLKSDFHLIDPFRIIHPEKIAFTWQRAGIASRLDRFYISKSLEKNVKTVEIINCPFSDHDFCILTLQNLNKIQTFGPGYWKCNVSILENDLFVQDFNLLVHHLESFENKDLVWWENFKIQSKDLIIKHSKIQSAKHRNHIQNLERRLRQLKIQNLQHPDQFSADIQSVQNELNSYISHQAEGIKIRSKLQSIEQDENPSKHLKKYEKYRNKKKTINSLVVNDTLVLDNDAIRDATLHYYEKLYSKSETNQRLGHEFTNNLSKLTGEDNNILEGPITYEECQAAIKSFENNKSPGIDGLPKEFYQKFFHLFGKSFVQVINLSHDIQQLSASQRLGLITLICKDENKPEMLKNWRPISLLNVDYKIISKVLTSRLSKVLHKLVNIDQTSSVPGRSILDNCHLFRNIIDYIDEKPCNISFISLDQEKAFDYINHEYMFSCLESYNISPVFINWVKTLYNNINSKVITNNYLSPSFPIQRGVRQGCPLSPLLYILVFETLLTKIRNSPNINGLTLPGTNEQVKLSAFADDATLVLTDYTSIFTSFGIISNYEKASGSKLNRGKSCGIWLGKWKNNKEKLCDINWINGTHKIVGFFLGNGNFSDINWQNSLKKFKRTLQFGKLRNLSFFGKSKLLNISAFSKFFYIGSFLELPNQVLHEIESLSFGYIWQNLQECINRKTIVCSILQGGTGLVKLDVKIDSFHAMHIRNLLLDSPCKWKYFAIYWLGIQLRNFRPEYASNLIPHSIKIPKFYKNSLKIFLKIADLDVNLDKLTTKQIYNILLNDKILKPKVEKQYPDVDFGITWRIFKDPMIEPFRKDLSYRVAHHVLPTNSYLFNKNISRTKSCYFCTGEETLQHLFLYCPLVKPFINYVELLLTSHTNSPIILSFPDLIFHNFHKFSDPHLNRLVHFILTEIKYTIWHTRNKVKKEHITATTDTLTYHFINNIIKKIKCDFYKYNIQHFTKLWLKEHTFCELHNTHLIINLP